MEKAIILRTTNRLTENNAEHVIACCFEGVSCTQDTVFLVSDLLWTK
jgi:hypothetical protein